MRNFVLPGKKIVPGNFSKYGVYINAGEKLYTKWQKKPQNIGRRKT